MSPFVLSFIDTFVLIGGLLKSRLVLSLIDTIVLVGAITH